MSHSLPTVHFQPEITVMPSYLQVLASRWNSARALTTGYFHSHWNTLEWVFTARLILAGTFVFFNRDSLFLGIFLLGLGSFGACVSSQWVRNFWLNISFAVAVFLLSVGLALFMVTQGAFTSVLLYIHILDMALSVWLCKRITEERFYYDACSHHTG